jgi:hypothetical protein
MRFLLFSPFLSVYKIAQIPADTTVKIPGDNQQDFALLITFSPQSWKKGGQCEKIHTPRCEIWIRGKRNNWSAEKINPRDLSDKPWLSNFSRAARKPIKPGSHPDCWVKWRNQPPPNPDNQKYILTSYQTEAETH